jgi:hypothetical protein
MRYIYEPYKYEKDYKTIGKWHEEFQDVFAEQMLIQIAANLSWKYNYETYYQ